MNFYLEMLEKMRCTRTKVESMRNKVGQLPPLPPYTQLGHYPWTNFRFKFVLGASVPEALRYVGGMKVFMICYTIYIYPSCGALLVFYT